MTVQDPLDGTTRIAGSDLMRLGWRDAMKCVAREGRVLVTNRREPVAVVLSIKEYTAMVSAVAAPDPVSTPSLDALRRSFDERLAVLQQPGASARLRSLMDGPTTLAEVVKAGSSY